jgi:hypothetical protein
MIAMQQNKHTALLQKYLDNRCSAAELQEVARYFANVEYPDAFDELLEQGWKKFKSTDEDNIELAGDFYKKFHQRLKAKS